MRNKDANLADLVNLVAERTGISVNRTKGIVSEVLASIIQLTEDNGALSIRSFGRFDKRLRKGQNLRKTSFGSGEGRIPSKETIVFKVSNQLVKELSDE